MMNNGNNMMGMGRGAAGMMMPGQQIPQMGMSGMPNPMAANMQAQQIMHQEQLQNNNSQQVMQIILRKLQQEPPRPGWWRGVGINERVTNTRGIFLACHNLLGFDLSNALNHAQTFELEQFQISLTKQQYDTAIKNKLMQIQLQARQRGVVPGAVQPMAGGLNMMMAANQPNAAPNQVFNPAMLNQNLQPGMMPNGLMPSQSQPQPGQLPAGMMANNMMPNAAQIAQAQAQARANGLSMQPQGPSTPQEQQILMQLVERIYNGMSLAEKETVKAKFPPHELMAFQSRGEDPVMAWARRAALLQFSKMKQQNQMGQPMGVPGTQFSGVNGVGVVSGAMNGQAPGLINTPNGPQMVARPPHAAPAGFKSNFEDFIGQQQARAMQEQQEGRTVVPASQQRPSQIGIGVPQNNLTSAQQHNPALQQVINNQPRLMQNRVQQPGMQVPPPSAQGISMGQPTPQPSPAPQALSRGLSQTPRLDNSNQQPSQLRGQPQPMPGVRAGPLQVPNQHPPAQLGQPPQNKMSPQVMASMNKTASNTGIPEAIQARLQQLPPAEQAQFIQKLRAQQLRNAQAAAAAATGIAGQATAANQLSNATPKPAQPTTAQQPAQTPTVPQPPMHNIGLRPGIAAVKRMTPQEKAHMDTLPFPDKALETDNLKQRVNKEQVKTWGQLKAWLHKQSTSPETVAWVMDIQEKQFAWYRMKQQQLQQEKLRQQQQGQSANSTQPAQPTHPGISTLQSPKQQPPPPSQQHQKPPQVTTMPSQPSIPTTNQPDTKAPEARMAQPRQVSGAEQFQRFILNLPAELSSEYCNQLRARIPIFRDKGDDEIRAMVDARKKSARTQSIQQQQQIKNLTALQNGPALGNSSVQIPRGPQVQPQATTNQSSVPTIKQQVTGASITQPMAQIKQEQAVVELRQTAAQTITKPGSEPQRTSGIHSAALAQGEKANQPGQTQPSAVRPPVDEAKWNRFQQLAQEVRRAYRSGPVVNMTPQILAKMRATMKEVQIFLPVKIMQPLFYYFSYVEPGNEGLPRQFFSFRVALADQFQDEKCTLMKDQFTISLEQVERCLGLFRNLVGKVRQHEIRAKAANAMAQPKASPVVPATQAIPATKPTDIKTVTTKTKAERPPDAPTSETPPNSFHAGPSPTQQRAPHGVPTYANNNMNELTPDQLVLPPRKRKLDNSSAPQPVKAQSPPQITKPVPTPAPPVKPEPMFVCQHPGCGHHRKSFPTGELLARHIEDAHKEKEPEDGLQFALEMARHALNLDAGGKAIKTPKMEKTASAQTMKKSASTQSQVLKVEGSVSMSRGTTQTSNLGVPRTPQSMGRSWDKPTTSKPEAGKEPLTPDSWADCPVTPTELATLFPAAEVVQGTIDLSGLTPASTLASGKSERNTPKDDVADNVAVVSEETETRIPLSFSNDILGFNEEISFMDDEILDLEWDEAFGSSKKRKIDHSGGFNPDLFSFSFPDEENIF